MVKIVLLKLQQQQSIMFRHCLFEAFVYECSKIDAKKCNVDFFYLSGAFVRTINNASD